MGATAKNPTEPAKQGDGGDIVNEEEESQRGVTVVARAERFGGAKIGRVPPVVAPKPLTRRPSVPKKEEAKPGTYPINDWTDHC